MGYLQPLPSGLCGSMGIHRGLRGRGRHCLLAAGREVSHLARLRASRLSQAVAGLQPCLPEPGVPQQLPPAPHHQHRVPVDPGPAQGRAGGLQRGVGCWTGRRGREQERLLDPKRSACLMAFSWACRWRSWRLHSAPCWHMASPSSGGSGLSSPYLSRTPQLGYSLSSGLWGQR